jgi:hypothetical protein
MACGKLSLGPNAPHTWAFVGRRCGLDLYECAYCQALKVIAELPEGRRALDASIPGLVKYLAESTKSLAN